MTKDSTPLVADGSKPDVPNGVDQSLEFRATQSTGRCFFVGNSHTYPGRMSAWDEDAGVEFSVSKFEIAHLSPAAEAWMNGFISGNEPDPPDDQDDAAYEAWSGAIQRFHETGNAPEDDRHWWDCER